MTTNQVSRYQLQDLAPTERAELLQSRVSAMLAFVDSKGFPRLVPCWFFWDGSAFYVTSFADKFHVRCLQRNPRASIGIEIAHADSAAIGNRQVKGVGEVSIFEDSADYWAMRIREKYLGDVQGFETTPGPPRVVIKLAPNSITAHGGGIRLRADQP